MSKRRRGWRQTANRLRRRLRRLAALTHAVRPNSELFNLKAKVAFPGLKTLDADADYDVHVACRDQLTQDGRHPPHDPGGKMDDNYHYADIDGYLTAVRARLAAKKRRFDFDHPWAVSHLSDELIALEGAIVGKLK